MPGLFKQADVENMSPPHMGKIYEQENILKPT